MTTHTYDGTFLAFDSFGQATFVTPTTIDLVVLDGVTNFIYEIEQVVSQPPVSVAAVTVLTEFVNVVVNGFTYTPDDVDLTINVAEVAWGTGNTTIVMTIADNALLDNFQIDNDAIFVLSGDPLPQFATVADYNAFLASITGVTAVLDGPVGPNVNIPFANLPNHSSTEDDTFSGGVLDDTFVFSQGADLYDGNDGSDTVDYTDATGRVLSDLQINQSGTGFASKFAAGAGQGDTYEEIENVTGGSFADNLRGDGNDNVLEGGGVSDRLYGRGGNDTLNGGAGVDALYGNLGVDEMTGGPGASTTDRFIYFNMIETGVGAGNRDIITDFQTGIDRIEIRRFDADTTQGGRQGFNFIADAAFSNTAGELRFEQTGGNTIVQGDVNGDGLADFEIELTGTMTLVEGDFLI